MKRFYQVQILTNEIITKYHKNLTGIYHLSAVTTLCQLLAKKRNLDEELAAICGYLHDLATIRYNSSYDHANRSAALAQDILKETKLFSNQEITIIITAIRNHSHKELIHDPYSELLKDADLWAQLLYDPSLILSKEKESRYLKLKKQSLIR